MKLLSFYLFLTLFSASLFAEGLDDQFEGTQQLTDEEAQAAQDYVHTGRIQTLIDSECSTNSVTREFGCGEDSVDQAGQVIKGNSGAIVEAMIPQLYSMMGMLSMLGGGKNGGGPNDIKMRPKADAPPKADGSKADGETKQDVCIYIPMAGEMAMKTIQSMEEKKIADAPPQTAETDIQKESLLKVARIHKARAKTATGQSIIYGSTTACYAAYLASGAVMDVKMGIKIAASGGLTALYAIKANNHKKYQKALEAIAAKIPGKGDCNPFTKTNCFCMEKTSLETDPTNYQKVCIPQELAGRDPKKNPMSCFVADSKKIPIPDPECKCKQTNSCFQHDLGNMMTELGIGNNYLQDAMNGLSFIGNGEFDEGRANALLDKYNAMAKKLMNQNFQGQIPKIGAKGNSNTSSSDFKNLGLSPGLADLAANVKPAGAPGTGAFPSSAPSFRSKDFIKEATGNYQPKYSIGSGNSSSRRGKKGDDFVNPFGKKEKSQVGGQVVETGFLDERAASEADITKNSDTNIFEILSHRYQRSGWSKLTPEGIK